MFNIQMAGLTIKINNRYKYVRYLCEEFITDSENYDFEISVTEEEILAEQKSDDISSSPAYCESLCIYRNICLKLPEYNAFLMHSAAVSVDGEAYIFTAKSGVGKTTHIRSWLSCFGERAEVVNGDKPIIRCVGGEWLVCGTPWRGKENLGGKSMVPIKALCFLERGEKNSVEAISPSEVNSRIFHQLLMPKDERQIILFFDLLDNLLANVPTYLLKCNTDKDSAMAIYEKIKTM